MLEMWPLPYDTGRGYHRNIPANLYLEVLVSLVKGAPRHDPQRLVWVSRPMARWDPAAATDMSQLRSRSTPRRQDGAQASWRAERSASEARAASQHHGEG